MLACQHKCLQWKLQICRSYPACRNDRRCCPIAQKAQAVKATIGLTAAIITILLFIVGTTGNTSITESTVPKSKVQCTAEIKGVLIGEASLGDVSCVSTGKSCIGLFSISMQNPLSLLSAEGMLKFFTPEQAKVQAFKVSRLSGSTEFTQELCTTSKTVKVSLIDGDGKLVGSTAAEVN